MIALTIHAGQLAKLQKALGHIKDGVPKALSPAINRTLNKGRTTVKREIRKQYLIKYGDIPVTVRGSTTATLGGAVIVKSGMLPLDRFKVKPRGWRKHPKPLFAQVKVGGGGMLQSAFYTPEAGPMMRAGPERLPIHRLLTIGAPIMATQPAVGPAVNKAMGDEMAIQIDRQIKRVLASA